MTHWIDDGLGTALGCLVLPAAIVVDSIADAALYLSPSSQWTGWLHRRRCRLTLAFVCLVLCAWLVHRMSPHIAGMCVCEQERAPESSGELDLRSFSFVELLGSTVATGWLFVRLCVELVCWHPLGCIAIMCVCKLALF